MRNVPDSIKLAIANVRWMADEDFAPGDYVDSLTISEMGVLISWLDRLLPTLDHMKELEDAMREVVWYAEDVTVLVAVPMPLAKALETFRKHLDELSNPDNDEVENV